MDQISKTPTAFDFDPAQEKNKGSGGFSSPVWPEAARQMKIDVAINADGALWVVHNKPFPDFLEWVEFDTESRIMTFVTAGGKIQDLGLIIHPPMDAHLAKARDVCTVWLEDGKIRDMGLLALTVREPMHMKGMKGTKND